MPRGPPRVLDMPPTPAPFDSAAALEARFADGLTAMLAGHGGLGVYILALANAAYDPALWSRLSPVLATRHAELVGGIAATLKRGGKLNEPDDDVMVFLKLAMIGFEHVGLAESRRAGSWQFTFNPVRALRPPRSSAQRFDRLLRPFDAAGFHFNKPFLAKELLWQGELAGKAARLLYNKFPFARLHGLLVPEPERQLPQWLSPEMHGWAWEVCSDSGIGALCLAYNSSGAGASVNHLHFQSFVQETPLALQDPCFVHNGGDTPYPLPCQRFADPAEAWLEIDRLHQQNLPYNLVYAKDCLHLVARLPQDHEALDAQCRGYGWSEMAGALTLFSRDAYAAIDAATFEGELARFAAAE